MFDRFGMPDSKMWAAIAVPTPNPLITSVNANLASEFNKRLYHWIKQFDESLDEKHEVGVRLVTFGQTVVFHLTDITFWNPSLIRFIGILDDGSPVELIQHVSQISVLLMKLPRKNPSEPKRKIGFEADAEGEQAEAEGGQK